MTIDPTLSVFTVSTSGLAIFGEPVECEQVPARPFHLSVAARRSDADAIGRVVCEVDGRWVDARQVRAAARAWDRAATDRGHSVPTHAPGTFGALMAQRAASFTHAGPVRVIRNRGLAITAG